MADNPAARNAHRAAADAGRRAAERAGVRPTSVSVVVETWSGPVGLEGSTLVTTSTLALSPRPSVVALHDEGAYFGGGNSALSGHLTAAEYRVGPMTTAYPGGGYSVAQLAPDTGVTRRVYYLLSGDDFATPGERFELASGGLDADRPHRISIRVRRTQQT